MSHTVPDHITLTRVSWLVKRQWKCEGKILLVLPGIVNLGADEEKTVVRCYTQEYFVTSAVKRFIAGTVYLMLHVRESVANLGDW